MSAHTAVPARFSVRTRLRDATGAAHERLDAAFARYDLAREADYRAFLQAHARALLPLEAVLADACPWPAWRPRGAELRNDLAALGCAVPAALPAPMPDDEAERWGMLYVLEGSRLGGVLLNGQVGPALPHAYLASVHAPGEWRAFLSAMEQAVDDTSAAERGAAKAFALFAAAADEAVDA